MKPDLQLAPDSDKSRVCIYFDIGSKSYGIKQTHTIIRDGVYFNAEKSIDLTLEQLQGIVDQARDFIGIHKKY